MNCLVLGCGNSTYWTKALSYFSPVIDPRNPGRTHYEPAQPYQRYAPQVGVQGHSASDNWVPRSQQRSGAVPQVSGPVYQDDSHPYQKSTNLQPVDTPDNIPHNMQYLEPVDNRRDYKSKVTNYYGDNYRQPIQQDTWSADETRYNNEGGQQRQENAAPQPEREHHHVAPYKNTEISPEITEEKPVEQEVNPKHVQEQLAHDLKHSKENMEHGSDVLKTSNSNNKKGHRHETYPDVVVAKLVDDDTEDGVSHIPKGAVLSLAVGLIITSVMAILIGCRLRVVRRRLRRGGKAYAHDADFLVNGMYL